MLVDAHVHLQPHGERPSLTYERVRQYADVAVDRGLAGIVFTEHLFRFREAYDQLEGWWNQTSEPRLARLVAAYWHDHVNLELGAYVELIERAKAGGLPVFLGIEMDWIPGRAETLHALLEPYPWDLILGSVHWVGAFAIDDEAMLDEWARRCTDDVFRDYSELVVDLADSRLVDVLAHPDLPKLFGFQPTSFTPMHERLLDAAVRNGCALEINTNGLRKPVAELYPAQALLKEACRAGVPITLATDAHTPDRLGEAFDRAVSAAREAGYTGYLRFARRQGSFEPFTP